MMAGLSGFCPQRRIIKGSDSEKGDFRVLVGKDGLRTRDNITLEHAGSFKPEADVRYSWCCSWRSFTRAVMFLVGAVMVFSTLLIHGSGILLIRANSLGRQCHDMKGTASGIRRYQFAMVTCSDGSTTIPHRSFEGLMDLVTPNKKAYVQRHGYSFVDASDSLDKSRPPSWSKILAVRKHLPNYEWVFWNDADSVVTNVELSLDSIIHSVVGDIEWQQMPDLIVTEDVTGVNAGMFFLRNSEWSKQFLDVWWNQTSFVEPFGGCKSGDNDALKYLIKSMPQEEKRQHVRIPRMQCLFNSNLWRPSWRSTHRLFTIPESVWQGVYAKGDFMVHLAGLNDKKKWVKKVLADIAADQEASKRNSVVEDLLAVRRAGISSRYLD